MTCETTQTYTTADELARAHGALEVTLRSALSEDGGLREALVMLARLYHSAALTSLPEEVARDMETVRWPLKHGVTWTHQRHEEETDAALSRLATAAARVPGLEAQLARLTEESQRHFARAEERGQRAILAESERDAARQEAERLGALVCSLEDAIRTIRKAAGVPDGEPIAGRVSALREQVSTLTARVAELEKAVEYERGREQRTRSDAAGQVRRATAAEALAKRMGLRCCSQGRSVSCACAGHWVCDVHGDNHEPGPKPAPTPAGLREAVGNVIATVREAVALADAKRAEHPLPGRMAEMALCWDLLRVREDHARALVAAYDATPATLPSDLMNDVRRAVEALPHGPDRYALQVALDGGAPPAIPHADLAAVVEAFVNEHGRAEETLMRVAAREVLRRATGGEVPQVLHKARVVEVLAGIIADPESSLDADRACRRAARRLNLTLPTGPGNPPASPDGSESATGSDMTPVTLTPQRGECMGAACTTAAPTVGAHLAECPASSFVLMPVESRHPRVRPEGPALAPVPGFAMPPPAVQEAIREHAHAEATVSLLAGKDVPTGTLVAVSPSFVKVVPKSQPEPAAPAVLMEFTTAGYVKERMRVITSGALEHEANPGCWVPSVNEAGKVLACALAEARLDARLARASLASREEALRQTDEALAEAKREREEYADVAARALVKAVQEAAQRGAEEWKPRAQALWTAAWNARAHLHNGRSGDAISTLAEVLNATTGAVFPPAFPIQPSHLIEHDGRITLYVVVNGVRLMLGGDDGDRATRHVLAYLFACPELQLQVLREGDGVAAIGRPVVVSAPRGEEVSRG